jgi:hypothetical protein
MSHGAEPTDEARNPTVAEGGRGPNDRTPRWVKVAGIIVVGLVLLFVFLKLTGLGGSHGPSRHSLQSETSEGHSAPQGVTRAQP